ncbi:hypothetical protein RhiirA5_374831 [Rhizophagus irregularis]|nr:hypothetical protein RhiirA5_374831 [Rhizophagus irregularis]
MPSSKNIELHWKCKELSRAGIKTSKNSDIVNRDRCLDNGIFLLEASVNWTEYNKWVEAGRPYEEHDEILMNLEVEMDLLKQDQLEPNDMLKEDENMEMETVITEIRKRKSKNQEDKH